MADFATRSLGIGYTGGSLILFACLMAVLGLWYWSQGSVSVDTVNTPKVEAFYWPPSRFPRHWGPRLAIGPRTRAASATKAERSCLLPH